MSDQDFFYDEDEYYVDPYNEAVSRSVLQSLHFFPICADTCFPGGLGCTHRALARLDRLSTRLGYSIGTE